MRNVPPPTPAHTLPDVQGTPTITPALYTDMVAVAPPAPAVATLMTTEAMAGVIFSDLMYVVGTRSSHTVCQMPATRVEGG